MTAARLTGAVYAAAAAAVLAVALLTAAAFRGAARDWLGFTFDDLPQTLGEAAAIFTANLRVMLIALAGCFVAQWPWLTTGPPPGRWWRRAARAADVAVAGVVVLNVAVIGAAFGAYGERMVRAALPHGPVELLAFSAALALYLHARRRQVTARQGVALGGTALAALAVAALLEAYLSPVG